MDRSEPDPFIKHLERQPADANPEPAVMPMPDIEPILPITPEPNRAEGQAPLETPPASGEKRPWFTDVRAHERREWFNDAEPGAPKSPRNPGRPKPKGTAPEAGPTPSGAETEDTREGKRTAEAATEDTPGFSETN